MFGMGMPEILLILAIALIVIGPKKLPDLAKSMGRAMREFKKATSELKESLEIDTEIGDVKKAFNDMNRDIKEGVDLAGSLKRSTPAGKPSSGEAPSEAPPGTENSSGGPAAGGAGTTAGEKPKPDNESRPDEGPKTDG